ncbi:MAG: phosphatidate cytidylyltransferase [Christensenellaceae bacterium]
MDKDMKPRVISAVVYVAVLLAFYALKIFVNDYCFDVLTMAFAIIGTVEMTKACELKGAQRVLPIVASALFAPAYAAGEIFFSCGNLCMTFVLVAAAVLVLSSIVTGYERVTLESTAKSVLAIVYPSAFFALLILLNHTEYSVWMILMIFVTASLADTLAHGFGKALHRKFPKKLAESISPNKTVVGGIGGLIGGLIGGVAVCLVKHLCVGLTVTPVWAYLVYAFVGMICGGLSEFGDLVESAIKRKIGIKDMGKIMPGHGGILDRLDGTMYVTVFVYLFFVLFSAI